MMWDAWFKRRRWERRMHAEFQFHLESQIADYTARGLSRQDAERRARAQFGALDLAKDECRDERPAEGLQRFCRDFLYAGRLLRKSPAFALAAIGTLALGIGANTAIFRLLDAVRLRTLPVANPQELVNVQLAERTGWRGSQMSPYMALTNPQWEHFRDTQSAFAGVFAWADTNFDLSQGGEPQMVHGLFVSGDYFRVLNVRPLMGRVFSPADDRRGCGVPGAVISYAFWQRRFGGEPSAIGRKLTLGPQPVEIIGVTAPGFSGLEIGGSYDIAVPTCSQAALWSEGNWLNEGTVWWLGVVGRLKAGATLASTNAQLQATSGAVFRATLPSNYPTENANDYLKFKLTAVPAGKGVSQLRERYGDPLVLLLATSGLVLLIACANLANLMLARAATREHEFAVRLAIGASRGRLIRQLMAESLLLAVSGAAAGVLVSGLLNGFLVSLLGGPENSLFLDLHPDFRMFAFTAGLAGLTCMLFGLAPAWRATRISAGQAMKTGGRGLAGARERFGLRQALVVTQIALSLVLLVGALLFSNTLRNLLAVDAGFQSNGILITDVDFSRLKLPTPRRAAFKRDMLQRIVARPGVLSAAEVGFSPLTGASSSNGVWKDGSNPATQFESKFNRAGAGYFKTMQTALLAGRDFNDRDTVASPRVAIVNQSFARSMGLGATPVGVRFRRQQTPSDPERIFEIVGLVRDTKYYDLREDFLPIAFLSVDQDAEPNPFAEILVRSSVTLGATIAMTKSEIAQIDPSIGVQFRSFDSLISQGLLRERLMAMLSGFFGVLAALIAAIGLYGVMSFLVLKRTNEIGVRMALGAGRRSILALIMRQAVVLLALGAAAGIPLALLLAGAARSILFGLTPHDAGSLALAILLLAIVTVTASYLPARRAARLEPMSALREE